MKIYRIYYVSGVVERVEMSLLRTTNGFRLESAAPGHVKDFEAWRCDRCGKLFVDPGDGQPHETERLPKDTLP